jgi:hypothetical protein
MSIKLSDKDADWLREQESLIFGLEAEVPTVKPIYLSGEPEVDESHV